MRPWDLSFFEASDSLRILVAQVTKIRWKMQPIYEKLNFQAFRILVAHFMVIFWGADSLRILVPTPA